MNDHDATTLIPEYVRGGLRVLPLHSVSNGRCSCGRGTCASPGKHPRLSNGKDGASTDMTQVAQWLARWPDANWGARPPTGVVILDIDVRSGGHETLRDLEGRHNPLPATLTAATGGGGKHYWLTMSGPVKGRMGAGIDVKTESGYVCLPPSVHASGKRYRWINQAAAVPAPRWVQLLLTPTPRRASYSGNTSGSASSLVAFVLSSEEGERNSRLFWAACRAHEHGHDVTPLVEAAESIGLSPMEAAATAHSASLAPARATTR